MASVNEKLGKQPKPGGGTLAQPGLQRAVPGKRTAVRTPLAARAPAPAVAAARDEASGPEAAAAREAERGDGDAGPLPLEPGVRGEMESAFGASFDDVRIHEDGAAEAAGALALARGSDLHFAPGQYQPDSQPGKFLLGHELAHVVQQRSAGGGDAELARREGDERGDERPPLEAEADVVGARIAAGGHAGPIQGHAPRGTEQHFDPAKFLAQYLPKKKEVPPRLPMPVTMVPLGDHFDVSFKYDGNGKLDINSTYKGSHEAAPRLATNSVQLKKQEDGTYRTYQPIVVKRVEKELWLDLFSDETTIVVLRDEVSPDQVNFDRRQHKFSTLVNGRLINSASVSIHLDKGKGDLPATGGPTDDVVSSQRLTLAGDPFVIKARRFGDSNQVQLLIATPDGSATAGSMLVPFQGDLTAIGLRVLGNNGRDIKLSLDRDKTDDILVVHTVRASDDPDRGGQKRVHYLRVFDKAGIHLGTAQTTCFGKKIDIPEAQDDAKHRPDIDKEWPAGRAPAQEDRPGETSKTVPRPGGIFEIRVDGDGDRQKELLLRFKQGEHIPAPESGLGAPRTQVQIDVIQLSSGASRSFSFRPYLEQLDPRMATAADGRDPARIRMGRGYYPGIGSHDSSLRIQPPVDSDNGRSYQLEAGVETATATFPKETAPVSALVQDDMSGMSAAIPKLGGVQFRDLQLGDYGDRFRFTLERNGLEVTFGVAGINANGGVAADGFRLTTPFAVGLEPIAADPRTLTFRVGPGRTITIHDRITAGHTLPGSEEMPEVSREHMLTLTGPVVPDGVRWMKFTIDQNRFQSKYAGDGPERAATTAAQTVGALASQAGQGDVDTVFLAFARRAAEIRKEAADKGLIPPEMYGAWETLSQAMTELDPMARLAAAIKPQSPADQARKQALQLAAGGAADVLAGQLSALTIGKGGGHDQPTEVRTNGGPGGWGFDNKFTGAHRQRFEKQYRAGSGTLGLGAAIRSGDWKRAFDLFDKLRVGFDRWIATKDTENGPTLEYVGGAARQLEKVLDQGDGTEQGKPRRVWAFFVPDDKKQIDSREAPSSVPMQLYTWRSGGRWWLRDLTNPKRVYNDDVDAAGHDTPPPALFEKLNWEEHFPNGLIRYQVQGGDQGSLVIDDSDWDLFDWLTAIGLGLAAAGIILGTAGFATPALVAVAASGAAMTAVSIHNMVEKADHNELDATTVFIEVGSIIASLAMVGGSASKIIVNSARGAALKGAAWTGKWAQFAKLSETAFVPIVAGGVAGDVTTILAMTADTMAKLDAIENGAGTGDAKRNAKIKLIAILLGTGALTALSIKGDLPNIRGKSPPNLVLDYVNGRAVAHAGGVRIGGNTPDAEIRVNPLDPDANAGARWQAAQLEEAARSGDARTKQEAADLLGDQEFMPWYRAWLAQSDKLDFKNGKPVARMPSIDGKAPPDHIAKRIQAFVDDPRTGIDLYEGAFKHADELREVQAAFKKAGVDLTIDPTHPQWRTHRAAVRDALGGGVEAEAMLKRYEAARGGAFVDPALFAAERARLHELVPDTELDKIRKLYDGYDVYITGSATQTKAGKTLKGDIDDLDVIVVVPTGTAPDLMHAIEKRADALKVLPDPRFLKKHDLPHGHAIGADVKVMTPEQFFGISTTKPGINPRTGAPRAPLQFHSITSGAEGLTKVEIDSVADATRALAEGKTLEPKHMAGVAALRRQIALGELDPGKVPVALQDRLPKSAGIDEAAARQWADDLAHSNLKGMTDAEIAADLTAYLKRKEVVENLYLAALKDPNLKLPGGISREQLTLAVKGDPVTGQRVPLTFSVQGGVLSHDVAQAKRLFAEFQADLKAVFASEGITDAVVVQLGSGTTGWSTAPGTYKHNGVDTPKVGKAWSPKSDTDFAIFSDQALMQAMQHGAAINPKNKQAGLFTTIKNTGEGGGKGFIDTPLGEKLKTLTEKWNARIYGEESRYSTELFDFKMNLQSDKPFRSAVPVLQVANPKLVPTTPGKAGMARAVEIPGRESPYFGVTIQDPRIILPPGTTGRREFHVTVLSPPELAALSATKRAKLRRGAEIGGAPQAGQIIRSDIAGVPAYQLEVIWPEAQKFRDSLGLGPKQLHVSLNGGIGDAVRARDAAAAAAPEGQQ